MTFIKDEQFIRGNCPMTKEEVRILSVCRMNIKEDSFVLDIGSGTGSITVQSSKMAKNGKVLAVERDNDAYNITKTNVEKFRCNNVKIIHDDAIKTLTLLVGQNLKFDSIFIGGSGSDLEDIIFNANNILKDDGTIVMNFIKLDNLSKAIEKMKVLKYKIDVILVNISKNKEDTLMMMAQNPVYILQCRKEEA